MSLLCRPLWRVAPRSLCWATTALCLGLPGLASAEPCGDLTDSVVVSGSSAASPLLARLAQALSASGDSPVLYYDPSGSCGGVDALLSPDSFAPSTLLTWSADGTQSLCEVPKDASLDTRVGISDVFPASCRALPNGLPSNVVDFQGPVQVMGFVVPLGSEERAISAEAAYNIFGFGNESGVAPWTDEGQLFQRDERSGTQRMIAAAIGVPAHRFRGNRTESTEDLVQRMLESNAAESGSALGILSAGAAATQRSQLRMLYFQDFRESCAFLPDASASSNEKLNVRRGDYPIWGPLHLLTNVDANGRPTTLAANRVVQFVLGLDTFRVGNLEVIGLEAELHLVPQCAMRVARTSELGPLSSHVPAQPCGCFYDALTNGTTSCAPCQAHQDCSDPGSQCRYGYCEPPPASR